MRVLFWDDDNQSVMMNQIVWGLKKEKGLIS